MMFIKGKDEALLKTVMEVMRESAQETEQQRKQAAAYLESTTYAGMRLVEGNLQENEPTGVKIYHTDKAGKATHSIVFTARDAASHEKAVKKAGGKVTHRALMFGDREGEKHAVNEDTEVLFTQEEIERMEAISQELGEALADDFLAMAKKINPNARMRPSVDAQKKEREAEMAKRAQQPKAQRSGTPSAGGIQKQYYSDEPGKRYIGDSVEYDEEQLDELSKTTLQSYAKKADADSEKHSRASTAAWERGDKASADKHFSKMAKRAGGSGIAAFKASMKKEEVELDEADRGTARRKLQKIVGRIDKGLGRMAKQQGRTGMSNDAVADKSKVTKAVRKMSGDQVSKTLSVLRKEEYEVEFDDGSFAIIDGDVIECVEQVIATLNEDIQAKVVDYINQSPENFANVYKMVG